MGICKVLETDRDKSKQPLSQIDLAIKVSYNYSLYVIFVYFGVDGM